MAERTMPNRKSRDQSPSRASPGLHDSRGGPFGRCPEQQPNPPARDQESRGGCLKAQDRITDPWVSVTVLIIALSLLPAPITLGALWSRQHVKPMKAEADELEKRALGG